MNPPRTLISADDLRARIAASANTSAPVVAIVDCRADLLRPTLGYESFLAEHLPRAQFADLNTMLAGPVIAGRTGRHPLPDEATFIAQIAALGIGDDTSVVCYDQGAGAFAARLWWLLRWIGHADTAVLDGGLTAWHQHGGALESGAALTPPPGRLTRRAALTRTITATELVTTTVLLDARDAARYRGDVEPIDSKAGHIPGAINAPYAENLTPNGQFKGREALRAQFAERVPAFAANSIAANSTAANSIAVYCGSGVTACHDILALVHAGYAEPALYPGSFSEWITDPAHAVATGAAP